MLIVETIAKIRRAHLVQGKSIKAIARELRVSRKVGSCPIAWCSSDVVVVLFGRAGRLCQAAMTGNLTKGSSLIGAMVSRET
jgi:hypothetical protein